MSEYPIYSIIADETTDKHDKYANQKVLTVCIIYVDTLCHKIVAFFLDFINLDRTTGEAIAGGLIKSITSAQLDPMNIRGQSYMHDGASAMSSSTTGVQGRIKQIPPRATYIHCQAHGSHNLKCDIYMNNGPITEDNAYFG